MGIDNKNYLFMSYIDKQEKVNANLDDSSQYVMQFSKAMR